MKNKQKPTMKLFNNYLSASCNSYYSDTAQKVYKQEKFMENMNILNNKTGQIAKMSSDFIATRKNSAIWHNAVSTHLNKINKDKIAIFITLTLDSPYHKFIAIKDKDNNDKVRFFKNKNYNPELSINDGYKLLNSTFRYIYNNFKPFGNDKKLRLDYFRVIEPHKDFTPHLHALIYIDEIHLEAFRKHFDRIREFNKVGSQYDYTVIEDTISATSYIMKYVKKSLFAKREEDIFVLYGWATANKIKMVTHSQISVPRYVFDKVARNIKLDFGMEKYDIIQNLLDNVSFDIDYVKEKEVVRTREHKAMQKDLYKLYIRMKIKIIKVFKDDFLDRCSLKKGDTFSKLLSKMDLEKFPFYDMMKYEYNEFNNFEYRVDLYYLKRTYDFQSYYLQKGEDYFAELYNNFVYENIYTTSNSYTVEEAVLTLNSDGTIIYDSKDFELLTYRY